GGGWRGRGREAVLHRDRDRGRGRGDGGDGGGRRSRRSGSRARVARREGDADLRWHQPRAADADRKGPARPTGDGMTSAAARTFGAAPTFGVAPTSAGSGDFLAGRVAVVTGASRGIGRGIALA